VDTGKDWDMDRDIAEIIVSEAELRARVSELGEGIGRDYEGKEPVLVSVLKGAVYFLADLSRAVSIPHALDFLAISSYGPGAGSVGVARIVKDLDLDIGGRHVLVVEDIIDTGLTLRYLLRHLEARQPASLEVCTLLDRPSRRIAALPLRYVGFEVPDAFLVGYGLDFRERYRNLPYIGMLKDRVLRR